MEGAGDGDGDGVVERVPDAGLGEGVGLGRVEGVGPQLAIR